MIRQAARAPRSEIAAHQLERIQRLTAELAANNPFQRSRLPVSGAAIASLEEYSRLVPVTTKAELVADQGARPPFGTNLTYELERYTRFHQTSGTTGQPMRWLDTPESWSWVLDCWERVFESAGIVPADRVFFPFSFGPFLGFWAAFDAAARMGCLTIPGGGMRSAGRLRVLLDNEVTVLCATPTYAIRLAEVAAEEKVDLRASRVRVIVLAGEPGGSIPATRLLIESLWPGARAVDHHGMTETGPITYECPARRGVLHVMEGAYYPEVLERGRLTPAEVGSEGELVVTNLGRVGSPLLRYRTGDVVRQAAQARCACGSEEMALAGGILARADEMVVIRGTNLYPSAVEAVLRAHGGMSEYRVEVDTQHAMAEMRIDVECPAGCEDPEELAHRLSAALLKAFTLRIPVRCVPEGTLPRFEVKARRWFRR